MFCLQSKLYIMLLFRLINTKGYLFSVLEIHALALLFCCCPRSGLETLQRVRLTSSRLCCVVQFLFVDSSVISSINDHSTWLRRQTCIQQLICREILPSPVSGPLVSSSDYVYWMQTPFLDLVVNTASANRTAVQFCCLYA